VSFFSSFSLLFAPFGGDLLIDLARFLPSYLSGERDEYLFLFLRSFDLDLDLDLDLEREDLR
jgi:hypothetical protein